jgi:predicted RNA-binding Zn-ribbon protein involved in translation (DUF1610 family)
MHAIRQLGIRYTCPVCGYDGLEYPPSDFTICPSCGVEFGYETAGRSLFELRQEWVSTGANWASRVDAKPKAWNPWLQLNNAHLIYTVPFVTVVSIHPGEWFEQADTIWAIRPNIVNASLVTR